MKKHFLVLPLFILLVFGCKSLETIESTKVSPAEISQNYRVSCAKDKTAVNATFYAQGASVDLDLPSSIELNGKEMNESKPFFLKGTDYNYSSGKFEPVFHFAFHAADGKVYQNDASIELLEIATESLTLNRSQKNQIQLSRAVAENESVTFTLRSADTRVIPSNSNTGNSNSMAPQENYSTLSRADLDSSRTFFTIDSEQLKNFALGKAYLNIEVSKNSNIQQSTGGGGSISTTYESQAVTIKVTD